MYTFRKALAEMQRSIKENLVMVRQIEARSRTPRELGYPWEVCDHQPLILDDALGRKLLVPHELSFNWEVRNCSRLVILKSNLVYLKRFKNYLEMAFQSLPGRASVLLGNFRIRNGDYEVLGPGNWQSNLKPNMKLIMSVTVVEVMEVAQSPHECPRCTAPYRGYTPVGDLENSHVQ